MTNEQPNTPGHQPLNKVSSRFIRIGGLAILVGMLIHIILNMVLKVMPPENPTQTELREYLANESGSWTIIHGFRYIAFICIVLFSAGMFMRTSSINRPHASGWGLVGLLGTALFVTNGILTNGLEMFIMHDPDISTQPVLFLFLFRLTRVLFTAEVVLWSILILGFSMAGYYSGSVPKWLSILGFINVTAGILMAGFIVVVINGGWALLFADIAALSGLAWFTWSGIYILIRGGH